MLRIIPLPIVSTFATTQPLDNCRVRFVLFTTIIGIALPLLNLATEFETMSPGSELIYPTLTAETEYKWEVGNS